MVKFQKPLLLSGAGKGEGNQSRSSSPLEKAGQGIGESGLTKKINLGPLLHFLIGEDSEHATVAEVF